MCFIVSAVFGHTAEKLQRVFGSGKLCLSFGAADALSYHVGVQHGSHCIRFVVIGAFLSYNGVLKSLSARLLHYLLQSGLIVEKRILAADIIYLALYERQHEIGDFFHILAAVKIKRAEDCLKRIRRYGSARSAAALLLSAADIEIVAERYLLCVFRQRLFAHDGRAYLCKVALLTRGVLRKQVCGHNDGEHGVAEKFQTFVALSALFVFVFVYI